MTDRRKTKRGIRAFLTQPKGRRKADRIRYAVLILLIFLAGIEALAIVSLGWQGLKDHQTLIKVNHAVITANIALNRTYNNEARLHRQLLEGCIRLNIQRATSNTAHATQYQIDNLFFTAARVQKPSSKQTKYQQDLTRRFLKYEDTALHALAWTPLTNCMFAVAISGVAYKEPAPISFATRMPPASALNYRNANLIAPVGSIP